MKPPDKRNKIAEDLRNRILAGLVEPGSRLPTEMKLADLLQISRDTLRHALLQLEEEHLIERIRGKGTFVCLPRSQKDNIITFLLPCADILADRIGYRSARFTRELLSGAIEESSRQHVRIETIAVSPTNDIHDIDWAALEHLTANSKVIVFTSWYEPLFSFLKTRNAQTALITLGSDGDGAACRDFAAAGIHIHDNPPSMLQTAHDFLCGKLGCRKICAVLSRYNLDSDSVFDLHHPPFRPEHLFYHTDDDDRQFREAMARFYRNSPFDGLFLHMPYLHHFDWHFSLAENLGLPKSVRLLSYGPNPFGLPFDQHPCMDFPMRKAGSEAVRLLCHPDQGTEYVLRPYINNQQFN